MLNLISKTARWLLPMIIGGCVMAIATPESMTSFVYRSPERSDAAMFQVAYFFFYHADDPAKREFAARFYYLVDRKANLCFAMVGSTEGSMVNIPCESLSGRADIHAYIKTGKYDKSLSWKD